MSLSPEEISHSLLKAAKDAGAEAADALAIDYDPLPAVIAPRSANAPGAGRVWDDLDDNHDNNHNHRDDDNRTAVLRNLLADMERRLIALDIRRRRLCIRNGL